MTTANSPDAADPSDSGGADTSTDEPTVTPHFTGSLPTDALDVVIDASRAVSPEAEATFRFTTDGTTINAVDGANVCMVESTLPAEAWDAYDAADLRLGIKLDRLADMLEGDTVDMHRETETWRLDVQSGPVSAKLATLDPDTVKFQEPTERMYRGLSCEWTMPFAAFKTAVTVMDKVPGHVAEVVAEPDGFHGLRKSGDTDDVECSFHDPDWDTEWVDTPDASVSVKQDIRYMKDMRKAIPNDATIRMRLGDDWPTVLEYDADGAHVLFVQSPRIDTQ